MKSASLFTGFGGADIGAQMACYASAWGVEYNDAIAQVARDNGLPTVTADVLDCDPANFERVDHLHASPPCPNFSVAKVGATETAHDIALADKVAEFITVLRPRTVTIENVPAYRKSQSYQRILKAIADAGYMYDATICNAADYGVPQTRRRLIVRAVLGGMIPPLPKPTQWIGWYKAIEDLIPTLPEGKFAKWQLARLPDMNESFAVQVQGEAGDGVREPDEPMQSITSAHGTAKYRAFLMPNANSSSGINRNGDEPSPTVGNVNRVGNQPRAFLMGDQERQMNMTKEPSSTIRGYSSGGGLPRAWLSEGRVVKMTPRALARFQSFPDWYRLPEKQSLACKGIGNAVPPLMICAILKGMTA